MTNTTHTLPKWHAGRIAKLGHQLRLAEAVHDRAKESFRSMSQGSSQPKGKSRKVMVHESMDDLVIENQG